MPPLPAGSGAASPTSSESACPTSPPRWNGLELDVLAHMAFPAEHRTRIVSTNPLERLHREIKRRTRLVGIYPNDAAVPRPVGAILLEQSDEWGVGRLRYLPLAATTKPANFSPTDRPTERPDTTLRPTERPRTP